MKVTSISKTSLYASIAIIVLQIGLDILALGVCIKKGEFSPWLFFSILSYVLHWNITNAIFGYESTNKERTEGLLLFPVSNIFTYWLLFKLLIQKEIALKERYVFEPGKVFNWKHYFGSIPSSTFIVKSDKDSGLIIINFSEYNSNNAMDADAFEHHLSHLSNIKTEENGRQL